MRIPRQLDLTDAELFDKTFREALTKFPILHGQWHASCYGTKILLVGPYLNHNPSSIWVMVGQYDITLQIYGDIFILAHSGFGNEGYILLTNLWKETKDMGRDQDGKREQEANLLANVEVYGKIMQALSGKQKKRSLFDRIFYRLLTRGKTHE